MKHSVSFPGGWWGMRLWFLYIILWTSRGILVHCHIYDIVGCQSYVYFSQYREDIVGPGRANSFCIWKSTEVAVYHQYVSLVWEGAEQVNWYVLSGFLRDWGGCKRCFYWCCCCYLAFMTIFYLQFPSRETRNVLLGGAWWHPVLGVILHVLGRWLPAVGCLEWTFGRLCGWRHFQLTARWRVCNIPVG